MKEDVFNKITPKEALKILKHLAKTDNKIKRKIIELAENLIKSVDIEKICEDVYYALDVIDVHELWDRAGPRSDGYISPEDMAVEMFEETVEPFSQELFRLFELNMRQEAKLYCMGILKGIYQYEEDSGSEFKSWATDVPGECFGYLLSEWKKRCTNKKDMKEMNELLRKECHRWYEWATKKL